MYSPIAQSIIDSKGGKAQQFLIDFVDENKISGASYAVNTFKDLADVDLNNFIDVIANFGVSHLNSL